MITLAEMKAFLLDNELRAPVLANIRVPFQISRIKKKENTKMTDIEKSAWQRSDVIAKTVEFLHKTDLNETTRRKMIRDIIKDNLINFYISIIDKEIIKENPIKKHSTD